METQEPSWTTIKDPDSFLRYYMSLHGDHYSKMKHAAIARLFPMILERERILDVGSGGGFYSLFAARKGAFNIILVDVESICIKAAKLNLFKNAGLKIEGIVASATNLPVISEMFDLVLYIDVIEHVRRDDTLLKEARRVLNKKGLMLISTQNSYSLTYVIEGFLNRKVLKKQKWIGWDPAHVRFYNPKSLFSLLRNVGFEVIAVSGTYFVPYNLFLWKGLPSPLLKIFRPLGSFVKRFNDILEMRCQETPLRTFGWGIICLCIKG